MYSCWTDWYFIAHNNRVDTITIFPVEHVCPRTRVWMFGKYFSTETHTAHEDHQSAPGWGGESWWQEWVSPPPLSTLSVSASVPGSSETILDHWRCRELLLSTAWSCSEGLISLEHCQHSSERRALSLRRWRKGRGELLLSAPPWWTPSSSSRSASLTHSQTSEPPQLPPPPPLKHDHPCPRTRCWPGPACWSCWCPAPGSSLGEEEQRSYSWECGGELRYPGTDDWSQLHLWRMLRMLRYHEGEIQSDSCDQHQDHESWQSSNWSISSNTSSQPRIWTLVSSTHIFLQSLETHDHRSSR